MPQCAKCLAPIVWMGTAGGKRMPIDAVMRKDLFYQKMVWAKEPKPGEPQAPPTPVLVPVSGYTSHLTTCPHRNSDAPKT